MSNYFHPFTGKRPRVRTPAAAAYLGWSTSTLNKRRVYGDSPPYYKVGGIVVYDLDDLDAWLAAHRRASTSEER